MNVRLLKYSLKAFFTFILLTACSSHERLEEGQIEVKKVFVVTDDAVTENNPNTQAKTLRAYVRQLPGRVEGKKKHLAYDPHLTSLSCTDLTLALRNNGYLQASVTSDVKMDKTAEVTYTLHPGKVYSLREVTYDIQDEGVDSILSHDFHIHDRDYARFYGSPLVAGSDFSVNALNQERDIITSHLQNNGFYRFNKDFIRFHADTIPHENAINLQLILLPYKQSNNAPLGPHKPYDVRSITYDAPDNNKVLLRPSVLRRLTMIKEGEPYRAQNVEDTYKRFGRLQAVRYTNIRFNETPDSMLDCTIQLATAKSQTVSFQPEGTNTAGNLGAAATLSYEHRNLFHGSETWTIQLRGAFEAITGLEGYQNHNYEEYGLESSISVPRFLAPFSTQKMRNNITAQSDLVLSYNLQNRPEFHRRVFSAGLRYRWSEPSGRRQWKLDVVDLNYIHMPWISETFKRDYLDSVSNRNMILRYNYRDLFIMKIGLGMSYSQGNNAFKWSVETAGNMLHGLSALISPPKNDAGQNKVFGIAYAQYVKGDVDATHIFKLTPNSEFVVHAALGIAYPYGNSSVLPFEKRYFGGGANSVRGWSVRGLGPGKFRGSDGRIDFINQTGDIKLDMNMEYRMPLFWKFSGALFVDAGNIWTIRDYPDQPGGVFRFNTFYKQLAAAYGAGLRMNFGYFILRFDMGMKAINPAFETSREHYPIFHPNLSRDFSFHFAVGLPF